MILASPGDLIFEWPWRWPGTESDQSPLTVEAALGGAEWRQLSHPVAPPSEGMRTRPNSVT
jgi:hypothetical protein